ncbi:hypothetical protein B0H10DRAFT_677047 [Mycena sp. CBHHK59/15]|nr:hypothetical protein B0H10DRAFT_677047 [Mycena sp. CBHHK59/15]
MGRTLSLVSRYVRNASRHVKFQAITINSLTDLTAFVGILESTPPHLRRVRFLTVLIDATEPSAMDWEVQDAHKSIARWRINQLLRLDRARRASEGLSRLLAMTALTLVELEIGFHNVDQRPFTFLPCLSFPHLVRLFFAGGQFPVPSATDLPYCPQLHELEVCVSDQCYEDLCSQIIPMAPSLVVLTVMTRSPWQGVALLGGSTYGYQWQAMECELDFKHSPDILTTVKHVVFRPLALWSCEWEMFTKAAERNPKFTVCRSNSFSSDE